MVEYKCERCHYITTKKSSFNNHLNRKTPCKAIHSTITIKELLDELNKPKEGFACNKCNKVFKTRQSKYQHQKLCKMDLVVKKQNEENILMILENRIKELEENQKTNTHIENQNIENQNNIETQNNIVINFTNEITNENKSYLLHNLKRTLEGYGNLNSIEIAEKIPVIMRNLLKNIHFDKDSPKYHNLRLKNKDDENMNVYENDKWNEVDVKKKINEIILYLCDIISEIGGEDDFDVFRNPLNTCSKLSELQDKIYDLWYNTKKKTDDENTFDNVKDTIHEGTQDVQPV
tara:strand:- start:87 stop:956 length:870 start_codon:yes stop_codon:yes gene_type:complete